MKCIKFIKMKIIFLVTFFPSYCLHLQLERPNRYWWKVKREKERVRKARKLSLHFVLETEHCCFLYRKCWNRKSLIRFMTYSNYSIRLRSVHKSCGTQDIIESFRRPCQAPFPGYILFSLHADAFFVSLYQLQQCWKIYFKMETRA